VPQNNKAEKTGDIARPPLRGLSFDVDNCNWAARREAV
jgi:hypothetical protein